MKKYWLIYLFLIFSLATNAQRVNVSYLAPTSGDTINYHYLRLGTPDNYFGGLMHNLSHEAYGDGNDFTIYSYGNRDLVLRAGDGNIILDTEGNGSCLGVGTTSPETKLHVSSRNVGRKSDYGVQLLEAEDAQFDILSSSNGHWGSAINLIEGNGNSNKNVWSIVRQTSTLGDGSLRFNYGVSNRHTNPHVMVLSTSGNIGIGTTTPLYDLDVAGIIRAKEIRVETSGADFVFADDYNLLTLSELKDFIKQNKHLPEIAPAQKMQEEGLAVGELNTKLLQKVEELTLYVIQQNEQITTLQQQVTKLKAEKQRAADKDEALTELHNRYKQLEARLAALEND
jgi:hypothetical protein